MTYRPRIEGLFVKIEHWIAHGTGESHWRVVSKDNVTSIFGRDKGTQICDPDPENPDRVYQRQLHAT